MFTGISTENIDKQHNNLNHWHKAVQNTVWINSLTFSRPAKNTSTGKKYMLHQNNQTLAGFMLSSGLKLQHYNMDIFSLKNRLGLTNNEHFSVSVFF